MIFNKELFDNLTEQAKLSPRLRYSMDMRTTMEDQSQRILNALEPETIMPIHRLQNTTETALVLKGSLKWFYYDDDGYLIENIFTIGQ